MSRQYLEALELLPVDSPEVAEFIRADITGKTDTEIAEIKALVVDIMGSSNYHLTRHICGHDESQACQSLEES